MRAAELVVGWATGSPRRDRDLVRQIEDLGASGARLVRPGAPTAGCTNRAVQSLVFSKSKWTPRSARAWIRKHPEFVLSELDETPATLRFRQEDPAKFDRDTFRTIAFGHATGIQAVVACPLVVRDSLSDFVNPRVGGLNMDADELRAWAKDPRSALASTATGQASLRKLPRILERYLAGSRMSKEDASWMKKTRDFNWRHLRQGTFGREVGQSGYSARHIALKNWGHDPTKTDSPAYRADLAWLKKHPGAAKRRT